MQSLGGINHCVELGGSSNNWKLSVNVILKSITKIVNYIRCFKFVSISKIARLEVEIVFVYSQCNVFQPHCQVFRDFNQITIVDFTCD